MSLKNYYAILGVPQSADTEQIKAAFRTLAKKYHPDKAPENPFAATHFTEIQEAYEVLSHHQLRTKYDEERWLRGLSNRSKATIRITPEWVLDEAIKLKQHMGKVDTYHMNHAALRDYIVALLNDEHLSVLQDGSQVHPQIAGAIMSSAEKLKHQYLDDISARLLLLARNNETLQQEISVWQQKKQTAYNWDVYRPLIVLIAAVVIVIIIWISGRK